MNELFTGLLSVILFIIAVMYFAARKPWWSIGVFILICTLYFLESHFKIIYSLSGKNFLKHVSAVPWLYGASLILCWILEPAKLDMTSHGTASWACKKYLKKFLSDVGLYIGKGKGKKEYSRISSKGHLLTIAPTRSGKGVSAIIPNLLTYEGSLICIDPKGENTAITAKRRKELNDNIYIIDPWNVVKGEDKASINPIEFLEDNKDLSEEVAYIADALVYDAPGQSGEAHWNEEAKALISGLLMYVVVNCPNNKTLSKLREFLTLDEENMQGLFKDMQKSEYSLIKRCANRMLNKSDKEFSGVLSTAQRHTQFLDSHRIEESIKDSSFNINDLVTKNSSVFIVIPPDKIGAFNRWLRIVLTYLIMSLTKTEEKPQKDIMFFIDEFAAIGRFKIIETAMGLMAGYGMKFWLFLQDLSQLKTLYEQAYSTFISNSSVLQIFGTNDYDTAKYISDTMGQTTIETKTINSGGKALDPNKNSYSTTARNLLTPDEIMNLDSNKQIVFIEGKPALMKKIVYYEDKIFKKLL